MPALQHLVLLDILVSSLSSFTAYFRILDSWLPPLQDLRKEDVPLPKLGPKLQLLLKEVQFGRGFQLIRFALRPITARLTKDDIDPRTDCL